MALPNPLSIARALGGAIRIPTVTSGDPSLFAAFAQYLQEAYPLAHKTLTRRSIGSSLLYRWQGKTDQNCMLHAHMDVVPPTGQWRRDPFGGEIDDVFVHGRGTLDMKGQLICVFEAVESLLGEGFSPEFNVYISLSHDEEAADGSGAKSIAAYLEEQGVYMTYTLDEAAKSFIAPEIFGTNREIAAIGVCEKAYAVLSLTARHKGGHSSTPPPFTALGRVMAAAVKLEANPLPPRMEGAALAFFDAIRPYMASPPSLEELALDEYKNAYVRSTCALTMAEGSSAPNVLPTQAKAIFNLRLAPWDDPQAVLERCRAIVDDDGVEVKYDSLLPASAVSKCDSKGYNIVASVISKLFPHTVVSPAPLLGASDSLFFGGITHSAYRFTPFSTPYAEAATIHAANERIRISNLAQGTLFFVTLLKNS